MLRQASPRPDKSEVYFLKDSSRAWYDSGWPQPLKKKKGPAASAYHPKFKIIARFSFISQVSQNKRIRQECWTPKSHPWAISGASIAPKTSFCYYVVVFIQIIHQKVYSVRIHVCPIYSAYSNSLKRHPLFDRWQCLLQSDTDFSKHMGCMCL